MQCECSIKVACFKKTNPKPKGVGAQQVNNKLYFSPLLMFLENFIEPLMNNIGCLVILSSYIEEMIVKTRHNQAKE